MVSISLQILQKCLQISSSTKNLSAQLSNLSQKQERKKSFYHHKTSMQK
jgi:hypothetical protein